MKTETDINRRLTASLTRLQPIQGHVPCKDLLNAQRKQLVQLFIRCRHAEQWLFSQRSLYMCRDGFHRQAETVTSAGDMQILLYQATLSRKLRLWEEAQACQNTLDGVCIHVHSRLVPLLKLICSSQLQCAADCLPYVYIGHCACTWDHKSHML